jgi:hypothetical protein
VRLSGRSPSEDTDDLRELIKAGGTVRALDISAGFYGHLELIPVQGSGTVDLGGVGSRKDACGTSNVIVVPVRDDDGLHCSTDIHAETIKVAECNGLFGGFVDA